MQSNDKRRNVVALTEKGNELSEKIRIQQKDVGNAVETLIDEATHNLWEAIEEWEFLLGQKSLLKRVQEQEKIRESKNATIVSYKPEHQSAFKSLNEEWISTYFEMEAADYKAFGSSERIHP